MTRTESTERGVMAENTLGFKFSSTTSEGS